MRLSKFEVVVLVLVAVYIGLLFVALFYVPDPVESPKCAIIDTRGTDETVVWRGNARDVHTDHLANGYKLVREVTDETD